MPTLPFALPIVDRVAELALVAHLRAAAAKGAGGMLLLSGDGGVGKTRLITETAAPARGDGWRIAVGRAYAVETAIPYAPFADALEPLLSALDPNVLTRITRGDRSAIRALAPSLVTGAPADAYASSLNVAEQRVRLHSTIVQIIGKLAEREPLFLVLENMHWADASSVELFHFLARQVHTLRVVLIATWNETERELPPALGTAIRSLRSLGMCREIRLEPLTAVGVALMVSQAFAVPSDSIANFTKRLFEVTRGNPLFIEQLLRELIQRGELRLSGSVWVGWELETFVLPPTVRDLLRARINRLSHEARSVAEWAATIGTEAEHDLLFTVTGLIEPAWLDVLDELRGAGMLAERLDGSVLYYDMSHPLIRQAFSELVGMTRERGMHAAIANTLEDIAGVQAEERAEQIAAHWRRTDPHVEPARAIHWLTLASARAMARLARHEAADLLRAALDRADGSPDAVDDDRRRILVDDLSRLYRRLGEYSSATAMATRARDDARTRGDVIGVAVAERRLGLSAEGIGRRRDAIAHFDVGIRAATEAGDDVLVARIRLAKCNCLQALGLPEEAKEEVALALAVAERTDRISLLARAHRIQLMLSLWSGPTHRAWTHARSAVALAERSGERNLAWSAHWASAVLAAMTSNASALQRHLTEATRLAEELASPLLQLRSAEISIEYQSVFGEWSRALMDGERAVQTARSLEQKTLLARLLFWVGSIHLMRGDATTAKRQFDEAWDVSGAGAMALGEPFEVHGVLPAHVARVTYLVAVGEHAQALALGRVAVEIADRTGNIAWTVHRLLPTLAEAALAMRDPAALAEVRRRLAHDAAWLAHPIGHAWVKIIDAAVSERDGDTSVAIAWLQQAVSELEAVPYAYDAAQARLRLARVLLGSGDASEATSEARAALHVFEALDAKPAAEQAREMLRSLGAHVPVTQLGTDAFASLTTRELEIVALVAQRQSNKVVGRTLGISARTVGTHLANVFGKTGIRDRTLLGDAAREQGLHRA